MPPLLASQMKLGAPDGAAEAPPPSAWDTVGASVNSTVDRIPDVQDWRMREAYAGLSVTLQDLNDAGYLRYNNPVGSLFGDHFDEDQIWADIASLRQRDPERFKSLPASRADFEKQVLTRHGRADRDAQTAARGGAIPRFVGGMVGSFRDPRNIAATIVSGGGNSILSAMGREAVVNMAIEGAQTPQNIIAARRLGDDPGVRDVATNILMAGLGAAAITGTVKGVGRVSTGGVDVVRGRFETMIADNWDKLPAGLREKWGSAAKVDGTALPEVFEALVGRDNMSLDEKGAVALLRREGELEALNPFRPDGAGIEAHNAAVARNVERIAAEIHGMRAPRSVAAAAGDSTAIASGTVTPASGGRAALKAKIGRAESPSDVAKNPRSSATGRYQFVSDTWLSYYKRRYGSQGLTDAQILAKRTDGNVQEVLMDDLLADNARFLQREGQPETAGNLYLTHFAGQGGARKLFHADPNARAVDVLGADVVRANPFLADMTARDVIAWAARKMDEAPSAVGGVGRGAGDAVDPEAAVRADLQARTMQLEADRAALDAEAAARAVDDDIVIEVGRIVDQADDLPAPGPMLRRDMFPDDDSWRVAQAAVDAEMRSAPMPSIVDAIGDTRGGGVQYHGARGQIAELGEGYYNPANIYGGADTFYTTDAIDIAKGYQRRREAGTIYRIDEVEPVQMFDMERPLSAGEARAIFGGDDLASSAIDEATANGAAGLREIMDEIREMSRAEGVTRDEVQEIFDSAIYNLQQQGFGGMRHIGGLKTERAPHEVKIYFDARNQLRLTEMREPRDAGGLTAAERASLDYDEPGLRDFVDPAGEGNRLDLDGSVHDLRAAIDTEDPLSGVAFATRDGIDETPADALAAIEAEEAALAALRACL